MMRSQGGTPSNSDRRTAKGQVRTCRPARVGRQDQARTGEADGAREECTIVRGED
ncbi:hypothetical protein [Streptomyces sp. CB00455]|uniref:hypothetical protein n=1 Tax=Streptomyces sp. CB00455 TaxID=1703927 RepID=UPI001300FAF1|nr:hypothetical protein [Streptomyces sp. CB00455]